MDFYQNLKRLKNFGKEPIPRTIFLPLYYHIIDFNKEKGFYYKFVCLFILSTQTYVTAKMLGQLHFEIKDIFTKFSEISPIFDEIMQEHFFFLKFILLPKSRHELLMYEKISILKLKMSLRNINSFNELHFL